MYQGWVTHTFNVIKGCRHFCDYCYLRDIQGFDFTPRFVEKELQTNLGSGNKIFVGSTSDMFGDWVPIEWITRVLHHCRKYDNEYIFQSKNPARFYSKEVISQLPEKVILGTTIETNVVYDKLISVAPSVNERSSAMKLLGEMGYKTFITIEPIMDFDVNCLAELIARAGPTFVNIGADSKGHGLVEPSREKVNELIELLKLCTEIKIKSNLSRLK